MTTAPNGELRRQDFHLQVQQLVSLRSLLSANGSQTGFSGKGYHRSSKASRREDLEVEEPVACGHCSSFHFHAALAGMLGPTLIGNQVVEVCQPRDKRLLAATWVVVTVDRRIAPPTAAPERSVPVSGHSAPQCPDVCHAYLAGDSLHTPAFSHRGSVHEALANCCSAHRVDHHSHDRSRSGHHGGSTADSTDSAHAAL